ncbi:methyltransferase family protein [Noviherbaspirillum sp.]|uniref:methyltransferase family protein n=1 Tax=Noviherbaspirillum sp. TaxID=1926288 RepID=UPI002FE31273
MRPAAKIGLATVAFALLHSALASDRCKRLAGALVGERRRDAGYRMFYVCQSVATFGLLIAYGARLPARTLYRLHGPVALAMRAGQAAGLAHIVVAARQVGISRLAGLDNLRAGLRGDAMPAGPVAQGPERGADGRLTITGPFLWSRHPLNFSGIPIFWLTPHMTTRRLTFNLLSTAYFVLGSMHEEARLKAAYGGDYRDYTGSATPFFWPRRPAVEWSWHQAGARS